MPSTTTSCPRCNQLLAGGARFCASCGLGLSGMSGAAASGAAGPTASASVPRHIDTLGQQLRESTLGEYDIYEELGRGGMAAVYLALDLALNRPVAIKTMLPEMIAKQGMVQRFKREAQIAAALSHPHIIPIFTVKESGSVAYFVMKYIEGRSLESVITGKGQIPLPMAQILLSQVGAALAHAHRKGVVHRDIKPANIMIDEDGWAVVTDFGIAKVQEAQNLTATGTAIGTPHYMSPEQFHNKAITGSSDQYSLGVVAYEMLSGRKPFDGASFAEIVTQHLFHPVPDVRALRADVPQHVVEALNRMMAKEPADRFPDVEAAVQALGAPSSRTADVVRTQMIALAKSGAEKRPRISVPVSPVPVAKKKTSAAAPTLVERRQAPRRSRAVVWATVAIAGALLLVGGVLGTFWLVQRNARAAERLAQQRLRQQLVAAALNQPTRAAQPLPTGRATLRLVVFPPASVFIDGVARGQSSRVAHDLSAGTHTLRVRRPGWTARDTIVTLEPGQVATVRIELARRP